MKPFEQFVPYYNQRREKAGIPTASERALRKSYRAYQDAVALIGTEVKIRFRKGRGSFQEEFSAERKKKK